MKHVHNYVVLTTQEWWSGLVEGVRVGKQQARTFTQRLDDLLPGDVEARFAPDGTLSGVLYERRGTQLYALDEPYITYERILNDAHDAAVSLVVADQMLRRAKEG